MAGGGPSQTLGNLVVLDDFFFNSRKSNCTADFYPRAAKINHKITKDESQNLLHTNWDLR